MSWRVANSCAERKFGSATRKQIIMFLADKASDDGSGIWCSKGTIQRHTELGETTVKRTIRDFLKEGILVETGARGGKNGCTVVYRSDLTRIEALELTAEPDIETGATVDPVQTGPGTGAAVAGVPGPPRPPNHPKTIHKPPPREHVRRRLKRLRSFWQRIHPTVCAGRLSVSDGSGITWPPGQRSRTCCRL